MNESGQDNLGDSQTQKNQLTLMTKEELPDHRGYRVTFVPVGGMLRPFQGKIMPYPEWAARSPRNRDTAYDETAIPLVYASEEGISLLRDVDAGWLREHIFDPSAWNGVKIGEGNESVVYDAPSFGGKHCIVKLSNTTSIEQHNRARGLKPSLFLPNYLETFGHTREVTELVTALNARYPFSSFHLATMPHIEYIAGKDFLIEAYEEGDTVDDIKKFLDSDDPIQDQMYQGFDKEHWRKWYTEFERELNRLGELFFMVQQERFKSNKKPGVFVFGDFAEQNLKIKQIDPRTGIPTILPIDQVPPLKGATATDDTPTLMENENTYDELQSKYANDPALSFLREYDV